MQASDPTEIHTLDHYLFTGWPDSGVPKYPTSLMHMLRHVRDARVSDVPILVHCRCVAFALYKGLSLHPLDCTYPSLA